MIRTLHISSQHYSVWPSYYNSTDFFLMREGVHKWSDWRRPPLFHVGVPNFSGRLFYMERTVTTPLQCYLYINIDRVSLANMRGRLEAGQFTFWSRKKRWCSLCPLRYTEESFSAMGNSILTKDSKVVKTRRGSVKPRNVGDGEAISMPGTLHLGYRCFLEVERNYTHIENI